MTRFHAATRRLALAAALVLTGTLGAAAFTPPAFAGAQTLLFKNKAALQVDATSIEFVNDGIPPRDYPHVNHRSQLRFEDAAREWASGRFSLTGNSPNKLRITIKNGDLTEKLLPVKKGVAGWFTKDQSAEYEATLQVELAIIGASGEVLSSATGQSHNTMTVREDATEADKQQVWTGMIIAAFDLLDTQLEPQVRQTMAQYIR
jgi:hypothetical protein